MNATFGEALSHWRKQRKFSQFNLALDTGVSQRHVSFLETGRAKPSKAMILRLGEALSLPLRIRNQLLSLAGFASHYQESQLHAPSMAPVMLAIESMLEAHNPYPAIVVDRFWSISHKNQAARLWINGLIELSGLANILDTQAPLNIAELTLHPQGLRRFIDNWEQVYPAMMARLRSELYASGDEEATARLASLLAMDDGAPANTDEISDMPPLLPVIPLNLTIGKHTLSMFSVISTLGTPLDITADELRIETFYPADSATKTYFENLK